MLEHLPVGGENPGPGNKAQVFSLLQYGNVIAPALGELPGHFLHLIGGFYGPFGSDHQIADAGTVIHLLVEHDVPDVVQFYDSFQIVFVIHDRVDVSAGCSDDFDQVPKAIIFPDRLKVGLNQIGYIHHQQDIPVLVMGH